MKVGDIVYMLKTSQYGHALSNPHDIFGVVTIDDDDDDGFNFCVDWFNGYHNSDYLKGQDISVAPIPQQLFERSDYT